MNNTKINSTNKINGAVFFVDILGFGALTRNKIELEAIHYKAWNKTNEEKNNQFLAMNLLKKFRNNLIQINKNYSHVKVAQLSDCAFIWSENISEVILFVNNFMTRAIEDGILCRGGLAYGEILETDDSFNKIGQFILGDAVTRAVELEGKAKGCRVLIDDEFPSALYEFDKSFSNQIMQLFSPFHNLLDYSIYDEFKWYLVPHMSKKTNLIHLKDIEKIDLTKARLKLASLLRYSDKFHWNSLSQEGFIHIRASLDFITDYNYEVINVWHDFRWDAYHENWEISKNQNRSTSMLSRANEIIESSQSYKIIDINSTINKKW
ncbi:hypothetical protein ABE179_01405 [Aliarcobacter skirrowii]|uniref:hypothetical protein n=1 Tax=Aliarcobacter skirrowii TaxID=28200 RepID=UPI00320B0DCE